jgi:hypothetical protein
LFTGLMLKWFFYRSREKKPSTCTFITHHLLCCSISSCTALRSILLLLLSCFLQLCLIFLQPWRW